MPIDLFHCAAGCAYGRVRASRRIGTQQVRRGISVLMNFFGPQVDELIIADVFKDQCFAAVAHDDPLARTRSCLLHDVSSKLQPGRCCFSTNRIQCRLKYCTGALALPFPLTSCTRKLTKFWGRRTSTWKNLPPPRRPGLARPRWVRSLSVVMIMHPFIAALALPADRISCRKGS